MSNTYTWLVESIDCYPQAEGQTDVAFNVHWRANSTDGTHNATIYSTCGVTYVAGSPFTPFAQLTQQQVLEWIWASAVDQTATQTALDTMIANQINPPVVTPKLPWSA
jgi:ABC-type Fe3+ transport system permease subunit